MEEKLIEELREVKSVGKSKRGRPVLDKNKDTRLERLKEIPMTTNLLIEELKISIFDISQHGETDNHNVAINKIENAINLLKQIK